MSFSGSSESIQQYDLQYEQNYDLYGANVDFDTVSIGPTASIERQRHGQRSRTNQHRGGQKDDVHHPHRQSLPNLANLGGSSASDAVYLIEYPGGRSGFRKWLVFPYCFLYMAAYATSYFTFIQYVYNKIQTDMFPNMTQLNSNGSCDVDTNSTAYKDQQVVQQHASRWSMYISLAVGIPAIISNILFGTSTDKFGRKFLLFLPCAGTLVRMVVTVVGIYTNFDLVYFLCGYVVEGITGQMFTMLLVCFTYMADITPDKGRQRSLSITMIELSIGLSVAGFSFSTGYFIENYGFLYPMVSAGAMMALTLIIAAMIPESFPPQQRDTSASTCQTLHTAFDLFFGTFNRGRRWIYNTLLMVFTLTMFCVFGRSSVEPLYQLDEPFCWSPVKLGYYSALRSLLQQLVGMGLVAALQIAMSDVSIAMLGCVSYLLANITEALAKTDTVLYLVPVISVCGLLTVPMCRSLLSKMTRSDQQGAVFAAIAAMESSVNMFGTVVGNEIYSHTLTFYRGFVFFFFAACNVVCLLLLWIYRIGTRKRT